MKPAGQGPVGTPSVSIHPASSTANRFVSLFAEAFSGAGWRVRPLNWGPPPALWASEINIIHWPNEFYRPAGLPYVRALVRVALMYLSRRWFRVSWVWVVHNLVPHRREGRPSLIWKAFLGQLDGLVFLSAHSKQAFDALHPGIDPASVVIRHGDYRKGATHPPTPFEGPGERVRLQFVGRIQPYKNLLTLVAAAGPLADALDLRITGSARSGPLRDSLERVSAGHNHVALDLARGPMSEAEIERTVDSCDAVILPYRRILNSGAAILALSRNRPVIAPAIGGLADLRDEVGADWVHLYEGDLTDEKLRRAADWVKTAPRGSTCPLEAYDWDRIGPELVKFVGSLRR